MDVQKQFEEEQVEEEEVISVEVMIEQSPISDTEEVLFENAQLLFSEQYPMVY